MTLYESMMCAYGGCGQHPSSHNGGYNHCVDCNDSEALNYSAGMKINYVSCHGSKCRCSLDQWDSSPLYCIECYGQESADEDLQEYIKKHTVCDSQESDEEDL
jgi:hypothetical protein